MCTRLFACLLVFAATAGLPLARLSAGPPPLRIATFQVDATPPIGSPLCDGAVEPVKEIVDPLSARGLVLLGSERPIVLCAVDWVGIANGGNDAWRKALAAAAGTTVDRVGVHSLHQHDAPGCDFEAAEILAAHGLGGGLFDVTFAKGTIERAAAALREAIKRPTAVNRIGLGRAKVEKVASSRRVLGSNGKVRYIRWSSGNSAEVRAESDGTIDPDVRLVSFWDGERPLAVLTYYATHPMAFYGKGGVSADFAGRAREIREAALPGVAHIHFDGAGGDVTAGKYNGGTPADRRLLAERLAAGMKTAWQNERIVPIAASEVSWQTAAAFLPASPSLGDEARLSRRIDNARLPLSRRLNAACDLAWARREKAGHPITLGCLRLGPAYVLDMPGELSIEYQLAAQRRRPADFVCMAAYGDYGPGYICMAAHYSQGGYEPTGSRVGPAVEAVLLAAINELLK